MIAYCSQAVVLSAMVHDDWQGNNLQMQLNTACVS